MYTIMSLLRHTGKIHTVLLSSHLIKHHALKLAEHYVCEYKHRHPHCKHHSYLKLQLIAYFVLNVLLHHVPYMLVQEHKPVIDLATLSCRWAVCYGSPGGDGKIQESLMSWWVFKCRLQAVRACLCMWLISSHELQYSDVCCLFLACIHLYASCQLNPLRSAWHEYNAHPHVTYISIMFCFMQLGMAFSLTVWFMWSCTPITCWRALLVKTRSWSKSIYGGDATWLNFKCYNLWAVCCKQLECCRLHPTQHS